MRPLGPGYRDRDDDKRNQGGVSLFAAILVLGDARAAADEFGFLPLPHLIRWWIGRTEMPGAR
jgi:hypothetical protein